MEQGREGRGGGCGGTPGHARAPAAAGRGARRLGAHKRPAAAHLGGVGAQQLGVQGRKDASHVVPAEGGGKVERQEEQVRDEARRRGASTRVRRPQGQPKHATCNHAQQAPSQPNPLNTRLKALGLGGASSVKFMMLSASVAPSMEVRPCGRRMAWACGRVGRCAGKGAAAATLPSVGSTERHSAGRHTSENAAQI